MYFSLSHRGLTLLELLIVIVIIATLAGIALPSYRSYQERGLKLDVISEFKTMETDILIFKAEQSRWPATLAEAGFGVPLDPWGNPYIYYPVDSVPKGKLRKDRFLNPVNTDFDLFSMGKDGDYRKSFAPKQSHDDIIRCNNGAFMGYAKDF